MSEYVGPTHKTEQPRRQGPSAELTRRVKEALDGLCEGTHPMRTQWFTAQQVANVCHGVKIGTVQGRLDELANGPDYEVDRPQRATGHKRVYRRKPK